jgi:hypothetical protein
MKLAVACCVLAMALTACASTNVSELSKGSLPLDVENGVGSEHGNYEMVPAGETRDAAGDRCFVFNWDRPLNKDFAIRYTSASCESREHPIWMSATPYTRKVIPISESNLKGAQGQTAN